MIPLLLSIGTLVLGMHLAIGNVLLFDSWLSGNQGFLEFCRSGQYESWLLSQIEVAVFYCFVMYCVAAFSITRKSLFLYVVALLIYTLAGTIVLYVRCIGGLGGLWLV